MPGIHLIKKKTEESTIEGFEESLDFLTRLYGGKVEFKYDNDQDAVVVMKSGRVVGTVRAEGALHTVIWAALSLAEKEA